jgi:hypothetical protein
MANSTFILVSLVPARLRPGMQKRRIAMSRNFKVLLIALLVVVLAGGAYAFAAQNTVPDSGAGFKASVVSGYTVSNIVYDLKAADPTKIDEITFDIAPSAGTVLAETVKIQTAENGGWTDCTLGAAEDLVKPVTCTFTASPYLFAADITALNVVASSTLDPAP